MTTHDPSAHRMTEHEHQCRICNAETPLTRHHLISRHEQARRNTPIKQQHNIVMLCLPCHRRIDHSRGPIRRRARSELGIRLEPKERELLRGYLGMPKADAEYPPRLPDYMLKERT